jgi:tRNA A-37 threonylcarbamoyl transferase component Bud32
MPAQTDILPPRYRDPEPIAKGGMGEIYRAVDRELGRVVAVKVLAERYARDESLRGRFEREALAAARLSGAPHVVTIFDVGEHDGRPIIVMEYLPGGSLETRLRSGRRSSPGQALQWLEEAARALDAAHAAGVVHRDVKPGNLLLDGDEHIHVADFGIASATGMSSFTQTGTILGTAGYLSPEQADGRRATPASDIYALGIVAWELLAGRRPFESDSPTAEAVAHIRTPVPSIHDAEPELPRALDAVFQRALAKDPAARYPSAAELVAELRRALHDDAGDTWVVPGPRAVAPRARSVPWLPALLVAALLAAGTAIALLVGRNSSAPPAPSTVVRTVTQQGTTVMQTVTAAQPPTASGAELNNAGFAKMQSGDFAGALPLLEQAVQKLSGSGSLDEAYADYNLAYTRVQLGQCTDVLALLDQAQSIEGHRKPIDDLRHQAKKPCGGH